MVWKNVYKLKKNENSYVNPENNNNNNNNNNNVIIMINFIYLTQSVKIHTHTHYSFPGWRHYILITNLYFVFEFLISFFNVCIFTDCVR